MATVEILTNSSFGEITKDLGTNARRRYTDGHSHYEIWEIDKSDVKRAEETCMSENILFCYSKGASRGTPYEILTINGQFVIGWTTNNNKDTFNCLSDYFTDGLGITDPYEICSCAVTLAKTNGWTLAQIFEKLEG